MMYLAKRVDDWFYFHDIYVADDQNQYNCKVKLGRREPAYGEIHEWCNPDLPSVQYTDDVVDIIDFEIFTTTDAKRVKNPKRLQLLDVLKPKLMSTSEICAYTKELELQIEAEKSEHHKELEERTKRYHKLYGEIKPGNTDALVEFLDFIGKDCGAYHNLADLALLKFINDERVSKAFKNGWYTNNYR